MASVTSTYARAFADVVIDRQLDATKTLQELQALSSLLEGNPDLRRVWENPAIAAAEKRGILDGIAQRESLSRNVRNFIAVLIDHRRIYLYAALVKQVQQELDARLGVTEAQITSFRELNDAEKGTIESQVARLTGKKVRARYTRDNAILGGAIVRVGSTIYDGSVLGQLQRIREHIAAGS